MEKEFTFDRVVRLVITALIFLGLFMLFRELSDVLFPFLLALLFAYLLNPIVSWIQKLLKNRLISIFVSLLLFIGLGIGLWFVLYPALAEEYHTMEKWLGQINVDFSESGSTLSQLEHWILQYVGLDQIKAMISVENLGQVGQKILPEIWSSIGDIFGFIMGLLGIVVVLLYLVFILMDYNDFQSKWKDYIPNKWRPLIVELAEDLELGMRAYFRQQSKIVLIVGVLFAIGFKIIGLPLAISLGIFVGLLNYIPYMQLVGLIPCTMAAALLSVKTGANFWMIMLWVALVFSIVQAIQEALLVPKLMGNITGFSPAIILLSLSIWGALLGVSGLIIALPLTTVIVSFYKRFVIDNHS